MSGVNNAADPTMLSTRSHLFELPIDAYTSVAMSKLRQQTFGIVHAGEVESARSRSGAMAQPNGTGLHHSNDWPV